MHFKCDCSVRAVLTLTVFDCPLVMAHTLTLPLLFIPNKSLLLLQSLQKHQIKCFHKQDMTLTALTMPISAVTDIHLDATAVQ